MDLAASYRQTIEKLLKEYADFLCKANGSNQENAIQQELIFDRDRDSYLLIETGWQGNRRIYDSLIHVDIRNGQLWIQHDGTEDGIANELETAGIPKDRIVLAYKSPERRELTEYAIS